MKQSQYETVIVGGGPAGLTAALYAARDQRTAILFDPIPGGQLLQAGVVENYPMAEGMRGAQLAEQLQRQAVQAGAQLHPEQVERITPTEKGFCVQAEEEYWTDSVIYAAGCHHRTLGVEGEQEFTGRGVSYCAVCDAPLYKGKTVAIIGGGNSAFSEALILARLANTVYLIHRREEFRAEAQLVEQVRQTKNIQMLTSFVPERIGGDGTADSLSIRSVRSQEQRTLEVSGIFVAIGRKPNSEAVRHLGICDEEGYIIADENGVTSVDGLFVAGDVRRKSLRQIVTAAGDGANCVRSMREWLRLRQ